MKTGRGWWALAGATAASVVLLYVGTYLALVTSRNMATLGAKDHVLILPAYRIGGRLAYEVFWPAYRMDCVIRAKRWHPTFEEYETNREWYLDQTDRSTFSFPPNGTP